MAKITDIYGIVRASREHIIKTMQERGIKELATCMAYAEWCKENKREPDEDENDDTDYLDYKDQDCPYCVFIGKYDMNDYRIEKVTLEGDRFKFEGFCNELGYDWQWEDDTVWATRMFVWERMAELLGIEDESEKVMVLYEVDEYDNTKTSVVAMTDADWKARKPETIEKVLRDYFDERYADEDDDYFCYEDEIRKAVTALTEGYDTEFNGNSLFWDEVEVVK